MLIIFIVANGSPLFAQWTRLTSGLTSNSPISLATSGANICVGTLDKGVFLSTNDGTNWTQVNPGWGVGRGKFNPWSLFLNGTDILIGTNGGGVFLSTNNGTSWTAVDSGLTNWRINTLLVNGTNIFAGTGGGAFLSTNNGTNWTLVDSGLTNTDVNALAVSGGNLFAGTDQGVFLSTNNGTSWTSIGTELSFTNYGVSSLVVNGTNIFAGTYGGGVFLSTNNGTNWTTVNSGLTNPNVFSLAASGSYLFAGTTTEVYLSINNGANWTQIGLTNMDPFNVASNGSYIFAVTNGAGLWGRPFNNQSQAPEPDSPPNGAAHQVLTQIKPGQFSVALQCNYLNYIIIASARVQAGTDSTFNSELMLDTTLVQGITLTSNTVALYNVLPRKTYYWRVNVNFDDSTSTGWTGPWSFTTGGASINGSLFDDDNGDSVRDFGEAGLANWRVDINGKIQESTYADSNGVYSFGGLDSGTYIVTQELQTEWRRTFPSFTSYVLTIGVNGSVTGIDFGNAYPWNSIEGTVYLDMNENGVRDIGEPGLVHWLVTLFGVDSNAVGQTDSLGHYKFKHVDPGTNTVALSVQSSFEQETPRYGQGYTYDVQTSGDQYGGFDFGVIKFPVHVKIPLTIYDNTLVNRRDIWFGIRPGATRGIWGVDPTATNVDFSEGEFEIPPQTAGLFDARFQDPHGGTAHFGAGSWTDVRDFFSTTQRDTFLVTFTPGYYFGGNYPMTIQWSRSDIHSAFPTIDPVLIDPKGNRIDMWNGSGDTARAVITDSTISSMCIITQSPNIPASAARRWNMVSIPQNILDDYSKNVFTTVNSHAFAYAPGTGYIIQDTLLPGKGYWIHYSAFIDSLKPLPLARLHDTISIQSGWNLFGSLSSLLDVNSITTIPSGSISSEFFVYNKGYSMTDTLLPAKGYWIKASQPAKMFLNASVDCYLKQLSKIICSPHQTYYQFRIMPAIENNCIVEQFRAGDTNDLFEAPPLPPDGEFDVRFSSNRILETIGEKQTGKFPIVIHGAEFPITMLWQSNSNSVKASIVIDGNETFLNGKTTIRITNPSSNILLKLLGIPAIPSAFALRTKLS